VRLRERRVAVVAVRQVHRQQGINPASNDGQYGIDENGRSLSPDGDPDRDEHQRPRGLGGQPEALAEILLLSGKRPTPEPRQENRSIENGLPESHSGRVPLGIVGSRKYHVMTDMRRAVSVPAFQQHGAEGE
jgi:hypothetical protein